jgi:hypothetical protein
LPSTVTTDRPDEATGFRHIGDPANALVEKINATRHPNVVKMHDAVDRWIATAKERGGQAGVDYLDSCTRRLDDNLRNLSAWAEGRADLWPGLAGVTVGDLDAAHLRVTKARGRLIGPYPFCSSPNSCGAAGRCLSDPVCND